MTLIGKMISGMVGVRFLFIWIGVSLFVLGLDIVGNLDDILALGSYGMVLDYAVHRLPGLLVTFLPLSLLIAVLLTLSELSYRSELTAIRGAGVSTLRIITMLLPLALLISGLYFLVSNNAVPAAAPALRAWGIGDYGQKGLQVGINDPIWMRAGRDILRADGGKRQATRLTNVIIFRRNERLNFDEQIVAKSAEQINGRWELHDVTVYYSDGQLPNRMATMLYSGGLKPAQAGARSGDPEEMSLGDLNFFIENNGFGLRPTWVYQTAWQKRISNLVTPLVILLLCVPLAAHFRRGGGIGIFFAIGIGLGFFYFIIDGVALSFGELGLIPPVLAAWGPVLFFGLLGVMLVARTETTI